MILNRNCFFLKIMHYYSLITKKPRYPHLFSKKYTTFATDIRKGALAHLARAFDWQSKGDEFDSRMLHKQ